MSDSRRGIFIVHKKQGIWTCPVCVHAYDQDWDEALIFDAEFDLAQSASHAAPKTHSNGAVHTGVQPRMEVGFVLR